MSSKNLNTWTLYLIEFAWGKWVPDHKINWFALATPCTLSQMSHGICDIFADLKEFFVQLEQKSDFLAQNFQTSCLCINAIKNGSNLALGVSEQMMRPVLTLTTWHRHWLPDELIFTTCPFPNASRMHWFVWLSLYLSVKSLGTLWLLIP